MSFFRAEALAQMRSLVEPVLTGAAAVWLGVMGLDRIAGQTLIGGLLLLGSAGLAGWCLAALARRWMRRGAGADGPGVVEIAERRIAWFGPETGGIVALDSLVQVAAWPDGSGGVAVWDLVPEEGAPLRVPASAPGAEAMPDALAALPGFDALTALRALSSSQGARVVLWRRAGIGPRRLR